MSTTIMREDSIYPYIDKKNPNILPMISSYETSITESVDNLQTERGSIPKSIRHTFFKQKTDTTITPQNQNQKTKIKFISKKVSGKLPSIFTTKKKEANRKPRNIDRSFQYLSNPKSSGFFLTTATGESSQASVSRTKNYTQTLDVKQLKISLKKKGKKINKQLKEIDLNSSQTNADLLTEMKNFSIYNKGMINKCNNCLTTFNKKVKINIDEFIEEDGKKNEEQYNFHKCLDTIISKINNVDYKTIQRMLDDINGNQTKRTNEECVRSKKRNMVLKLLNKSNFKIQKILNKIK